MKSSSGRAAAVLTILIALAACGCGSQSTKSDPVTTNRKLPPGWHDLGRAVVPPQLYGDRPIRAYIGEGMFLRHFCVDDTGRYVFNDAGIGVDTVTHKLRSIRAYDVTMDRHGIKLVWGDQPPPIDGSKHAVDRVDMVSGNEVAVELTSQITGAISGYVRGKVGGPITYLGSTSKGLVVTLNDNGADRPSLGDHLSGNLAPNSKPLEAHEMYNGALWMPEKCFFATSRPDAPEVVVELYSKSPPFVIRYPFPSSFWLPQNVTPEMPTLLSNGAVCQILPQQTVSGRVMPYSTAILDTTSKDWKVYYGLVLFGASHNGRYVAYGWGTDPIMRIGRVDP